MTFEILFSAFPIDYSGNDIEKRKHRFLFSIIKKFGTDKVFLKRDKFYIILDNFKEFIDFENCILQTRNRDNNYKNNLLVSVSEKRIVVDIFPIKNKG